MATVLDRDFPIVGRVQIIYDDPAIVGIAFQNVTVGFDPVVFHFNPPIAGLDQINPPEILRFIINQVDNNGATMTVSL